MFSFIIYWLDRGGLINYPGVQMPPFEVGGTLEIPKNIEKGSKKLNLKSLELKTVEHVLESLERSLSCNAPLGQLHNDSLHQMVDELMGVDILLLFFRHTIS